VERANIRDRFDNGKHMILSQLVQNSEDDFAFDRETGDRLAFDNGFSGLGIDDARHDCRSVTRGGNYTSSIPDVCGDCLKPLRRRIVIKRGMTSGSKKQPVLLFLEVRSLLELRVELDIESMLRVLENGFVASREKGIGQRHVVESEFACLG